MQPLDIRYHTVQHQRHGGSELTGKEEEVSIGPLPEPSEEDHIWAWRLWNTLQIGVEEQGLVGGVWDMPNVGRYRRTGEREMTLVEIHADMMPDQLGVSVWHKHDWIRLLADRIGWYVISDRVEKADSDILPPQEDQPRLEHIGKVWACPCGMVYTLLPDDSPELRIKVPENGDCLNPNCDITIPYPHAGILNAINDTAVIAKMQAEEMIGIARDEDEYPAPPMEPPVVENTTNDGEEE